MNHILTKVKIKSLNLIFCLLFSNFIFTQSIEETIKYINEVNEESKWEFVIEGFEKRIFHNTWEISNNGLITITRTEETRAKEENLKVISKQSFYVKAIQIYNITGKGRYDVNLTCKNGLKNENCFKYVNEDKTSYDSETRVIFNHLEAANRFKNALQHLIDLSEKEEKFLDKDPFK